MCGLPGARHLADLTHIGRCSSGESGSGRLCLLAAPLPLRHQLTQATTLICRLPRSNSTVTAQRGRVNSKAVSPTASALGGGSCRPHPPLFRVPPPIEVGVPRLGWLRGVVRRCRDIPSSVRSESFRTAVRLITLSAAFFAPYRGRGAIRAVAMGPPPQCSVLGGPPPLLVPPAPKGRAPATAVGGKGHRCPALGGGAFLSATAQKLKGGLGALVPPQSAPIGRVLLRSRWARPQPPFGFWSCALLVRLRRRLFKLTGLTR